MLNFNFLLEASDDGPMIALLVGLAIIIMIAISCIKIVPQATAQVIERLGTYRTTWSAGFHMKWPFIETVAKKITLMDIWHHLSLLS